MAGDFARPNQGNDDKLALVPGRWSEPEDRQIINWPLPEVELDVPALDSDFLPGGQWPADRARERMERLNLLYDLYRGDLSHFVKDRGIVALTPNYFARIADGLAALIASPQADDELQQAAYDLIVNMVRYGRGFVVSIDGDLSVFDSRYCQVDADETTLWAVVPFVSPGADDGDYDRAEVHMVTANEFDDDGNLIEAGEAVTWEVAFASSHRKGRVQQFTISEADDPSDPVPGGFGIADHRATMGGHGKNSYENIVPICFEIAKRITTNSRIMDGHLKPLLMLTGNENDLKRMSLNDFEHDKATFDSRDIYGAVRKSALTQDVLVSGQGFDVRNSGYLEWGGALTPAFSQLDALKAELRLEPGVTVSLDREAGDAPSGRAVVEMNSKDEREGQMLTGSARRAIADARGEPVTLAAPRRAMPTPDGGRGAPNDNLPADDAGDGPL